MARWLRAWWPSFVSAAVYIGFWIIWPVATFLVGCMALSAILGFLYGVGRTLKENEAKLQEDSKGRD